MGIAKVIEISSQSTESFDAAIQEGIKKASKTVDNIESAWIKDHVVLTENGSVSGYRVHMRITFLLK